MRGFAEGLEGFGGAHAGGLKQVNGRGPDLADEHAGLQIIAPLEHRRCLPCGPEREVVGTVEQGRWRVDAMGAR